MSRRTCLQALPGTILLGSIVIAAVAGCQPSDTSGNEPAFPVVFDACAQSDHPARMTHHAAVGQVDHCGDRLPRYAHLLTNWGTRPEWLSATEFLFSSNHMGHVWRMDIPSGELENLTEHFEHAGFTRVHVLANGDLLLLGLLEGEPLVDDPLVEHSAGRFSSQLYVLRQPFDGDPVPLGEHAWEGIAVSRTSLRIVWSTTSSPFWVERANGDLDVIQTAVAYFSQPSELVTALIEYDAGGRPFLTDRRTVLTKQDVGGPVFLEPQGFVGPGEQQLLASAYGPVGNGGDLLVVAMDGSGFERVYVPGGSYYEEWEGVDPTTNRAFIEVDWDAELFPSHSDAILYDFTDQSYVVFATSERGPLRMVAGSQNPVFSEDGRAVLANATAIGELPGYGAGILLFDLGAMPPLPPLPER